MHVLTSLLKTGDLYWAECECGRLFPSSIRDDAFELHRRHALFANNAGWTKVYATWEYPFLLLNENPLKP